jgi:hypothetical protein
LALLSTKTGLPSFAAADNAIINYFTDGGFERGSNGVIPSGWVQYNDGAIAVPVDGTGGSAVAQVTMLCTTSSPIRGTLSAVISKDANNRQGVGYSFPFTISNADKGITAGVNFELLTSANYVSGDMVFYIYDVTNSILITPRSVSLPALPSYGKFFSDFGLTTGTSYRFIMHIATTSALAYTVTLDTMVNTTTKVAVPGAINTNWITYTPTLGASLTGSVNTARWRQINDSMEIMGAITASNTGAVAAFSISLPSGYTVLSSAMARATGQVQEIGKGRFYNAATTDLLDPYVLSSTTIAFVRRGTNNSDLNGNAILSGYTIDYRFTVPISEFSGSSSNFGPGASIEYAYTSGSFDSASSATAFGPSGQAITALTGDRIKTITWQNPPQPGDLILVQASRDALTWAPMNGFLFSGGMVVPGVDSGGGYSGTSHYNTATTTVVTFYNNMNRANDDAPATNWPGSAAFWRVLKARPDAPVGQVLASTDGREGLVAPYSVGTGVVYAGRYTPTATASTNVSAATASSSNYMRVGNTVTVSGQVDITCTTAANTESIFYISLPIASNLTTNRDLSGVYTRYAPSGTQHAVGIVLPDTTNDRAQIIFSCNTTAIQGSAFTFQYQII